MSFSDMMSSGRGPGVIGMLMALVVLVGFGTLFMFAFDEGFQGGGPTIESEIATQAKDLDSFQARISVGKEKLALAPARTKAADELRSAKATSKTLAQNAESLKATIKERVAEIEAKQDEWSAYKDNYREFIRGQSKGQELATLETRNGDVYKNVSIREVTAVGIQIRHEEGHKRIQFEELTDEMQDHYQFDPAQKADELAREADLRKAHEAAAAVANTQADEQLAMQREKAASEAKEKVMRTIQEQQLQIETATSEVTSLEGELVRAQAEADAARAAGKMHLSKSGSINGKIRFQKNRIATLQAEIGRLQGQL
jgi:chromosome segregation ATPase